MKNLIILISLISLSFSVNAQTSTQNRRTKIVSSSYVSESINASNVIFDCQCIINKVMTKKGVEALKMSDVAQILGAKRFTQFEKAILLFNAKRLIFKSINGKNEAAEIDNIMKLKYGKRFKELATYVTFKYEIEKVIISKATGVQCKVKGAKELISYSERVSKCFVNNVVYTK